MYQLYLNKTCRKKYTIRRSEEGVILYNDSRVQQEEETPSCFLARAQPIHDGHNSANEKPWTLCSL